MQTIAIIGVVALFLGPWILTPIPAILAFRRDGLHAVAKPLLLSALVIPLAFIVLSLLIAIFIFYTGDGHLGLKIGVFLKWAAIWAAIVYLIIGAILKIAHL